MSLVFVGVGWVLVDSPSHTMGDCINYRCSTQPEIYCVTSPKLPPGIPASHVCITVFSETKEKEYSLQFSGIPSSNWLLWSGYFVPSHSKSSGFKSLVPSWWCYLWNFRRWSLTEEAGWQGVSIKVLSCSRDFSIGHELSNLFHAPTAMPHHGHRINRAKDCRLKSLKPSQDEWSSKQATRTTIILVYWFTALVGLWIQKASNSQIRIWVISDSAHTQADLAGKATTGLGDSPKGPYR